MFCNTNVKIKFKSKNSVKNVSHSDEPESESAAPLAFTELQLVV